MFSKKLVAVFIVILLVIILAIIYVLILRKPELSLTDKMCGLPNGNVTYYSEHGIWAGYIVSLQNSTGREIRGITATISVPYAFYNSLAQSEGIAAWLGLGGFKEANIIQAGITAENFTYYSRYFDWYEEFNASSIHPVAGVVPKENISISINLINESKYFWNITIRRGNNNNDFNLDNISFKIPLKTAEFVSEVSYYEGAMPSAFSPIKFSNISFTVCNATLCTKCPFNAMTHLILNIQIHNKTNSSQWVNITPSIFSNNSFYIYYNGTSKAVPPPQPVVTIGPVITVNH